MAREFVQFADQPSSQSLAAIRDQVPSMSPLYERGQFIHLKYKDGACVLLNEQARCSLPRDVRPRYCALYPLWLKTDPLTQGESLEVVGSQACQAVAEVGSNANAILKMFGFPGEEMMALLKQTQTEIQEHRTMSDEVLAVLLLGGGEP